MYEQFTTSPERVQKFGCGGVFDRDKVGDERFSLTALDTKYFLRINVQEHQFFMKSA